MATTFRTKNTTTFPESPVPVADYRDMAALAFTGSATTTALAAPIEPDGSRMYSRYFYGERVETEVTITGTITFQIRATRTSGGFTGRIRARLWKVTAGGSNIESPICLADATGDMTGIATAVTYTFTGTPTSATLAPGERFVLRVYVMPVAGSFGTGSSNLSYASSTDSLSTYVEFTETIATRPNSVKLHLRRTKVNGIGSFLDLLEALGSSPFTIGVVPTQAAGTEIQWSNPLAITEITAAVIASTTNAATYVSASYTPQAGRLYLLAVVHSDAAPEATVPTVTTTNGLAFVQVGSSKPFNTIASNTQRLTLFRAMKHTGLVAGAHTVTLADAGTGCAAGLYEVTGVVTTGADGADAPINVSTNSADASANPSVTMGAFGHANNGAFACFGAGTQTAPTIGSGWTALGHPDYATPATGLFAEWRASNDTSADCVLASSAWAGIAVELVAAAPGGATVLEWITPRMKYPGWDFQAIADRLSQCPMFCHESDLAANCGMRAKLFRRAPDGTETLLFSTTGSTEFTTSIAQYSVDAGTMHQAITFREDDRLILRLYIINVGTMAAGYTCTTTYDHNVDADVGDAFLTLLSGPAFKAEGDPAGPQATPSSMMLRGVGH